MIDATPLLRRYSRGRLAALARMDVQEVQHACLIKLLRRAASTRFGRDHGFASIATIEDYQRRVPLRRYEDFWNQYWKPAFPRLGDITWPGSIPYLALSSGTTGAATKYIPVSSAMLRSNAGAALDVLAFHLAARPDSRVLGGRNFLLGGSTALERLAPDVRAGDLSGIAADHMPWWARLRAFPPRELALVADWERKVVALAPASLGQDIRSLSGTPSWMLLFFDQLTALSPDRPRRLVEFYPHLELVVHGGVGFAPYRDRFAAWLEGSHAETREVYPTSEGFIASADCMPGQGLRLILDRGLFYEFVPLAELDSANPIRSWIGTVEKGVDYALVLTTNAGLWSYVLGDTVMLTDLDPPRLVVTGRTSFTLSAFGEHVSVHELDAAVSEAARAVGADVVDYAVGAVFPDPASSRGGHLFLVELTRNAADQSAMFANVLDAALSRLNADYAAHRSGGFGMLPPDVRLVPPGIFAAWMRRRGKLGGQNKVPRVINDAGLLGDLRAFVEQLGTG
jgi:GH3 auxin-responsive promoter